MKLILKNILANVILASLNILHFLGFSRQRSFPMLSKRLQSWVRALPLPETISVAHPSGKPLFFTHGRNLEIYKGYYWSGFGSYERHATSFVLEKATHYDWLVDIGTYIGHYTIAVSVQNPDISVRSFEPVPEIANVLRDNVAANNLHNVEIIEGAITTSTKGEDVAFYLPQKNLSHLPTTGSLNNRFENEGVFADRGCRRELVKGIPASSIFDGLPNGPGLLKMDTEGTEYTILTAIREQLASLQPDLLFEILYPPEADTEDMDAVDSYLKSLGYRYYLLADGYPEIDSLSTVDMSLLPHRKEHVDVAWGEILATSTLRL